jgi:predicted RNA-binding protein YlqC (UPF0109 family)
MDDNARDITALVQGLVVALVDEPDQVQVTSDYDGDTLLVSIQVTPDDVGKIIGRQGRIIKSIRTLARAASSLGGGEHVEVEVLD